MRKRTLKRQEGHYNKNIRRTMNFRTQKKEEKRKIEQQCWSKMQSKIE